MRFVAKDLYISSRLARTGGDDETKQGIQAGTDNMLYDSASMEESTKELSEDDEGEEEAGCIEVSVLLNFLTFKYPPLSFLTNGTVLT